ncbi:MAG: hypothetical protein HY735_11965 [Verrucomicrobia bacterium]|nr:hypothetical protein [Verrucomicrobiota bacterium]
MSEQLLFGNMLRLVHFLKSTVRRYAAPAVLFWVDLTAAIAQKPGEPDPSFKPNLPERGWIQAMVLQSDAKILLSGYFPTPQRQARWSFLRINKDGSFDGSFVAREAEVASLDLFKDGKILVVGRWTNSFEFGQALLTRLYRDGTVDGNFAPKLAPPSIWHVAQDSNEKVIVAGAFTSVDAIPWPGLARLNADGSLDRTFSPNVASDSPVVAQYVSTTPMVFQPDEKVALITADRNRVIRLHRDGSLDDSFNTPFLSDLRIAAIALQRDGKILLSGRFWWQDPTNQPGLIRLNTNGALDASFRLHLSPQDSGGINAMAVQENGKILIAGSLFRFGGVPRRGIARLNKDGTVDEFLAPFERWWLNPVIRSIAIQSNGDILVAGLYDVPDGSGGAPLLARFRGGEVAAPATITTQPESKTVFAGADAEFRVDVTSSSEPRFQWQFNGKELPGATNSALALNKIPFIRSGNYQVVVSNAVGRIVSEPAVLTVIPAGPLGEWSLRHQFEHATLAPTELTGLWAHTWGNGLHVVVGARGTLLTSPDGKSWIRRANGTSNSLFAVQYAAGKFVAVGGLGSVVSSADGITWNQPRSATADELVALTYGNGLFIGLVNWSLGLGTQSELMASVDGRQWRITATPISLSAVTFGNDTFVAVGENGTILGSANGRGWGERKSPTTAHLSDVAFGNGVFVATGNRGMILLSTNAVDWTQQPSGTPLDLRGVTFGNGLFAAVGGGRVDYGPAGTSSASESVVITSTNGSSWKVSHSATNTGAPSAVTYGAGQFVAVGGYGFKVMPGVFVNSTLNSADGVTWSKAGAPFIPLSAMRSIAFGNGSLVVASFGADLYVYGNGWQHSGLEKPALGVAFGNGTFIATASGVLFTSTNAVTWNRREVGTSAGLYDAAFGKDTFVVVGSNGTILQSGILRDEARPALTDPLLVGNKFQVLVRSLQGKEHVLEFKDALEENNWTPIAAAQGDGSEITLMDPSPPKRQRFYRVRARP